MYLRPLDDLLDSICSGRSGMKWVRWMDDIWLFGNKPARLRRAQTEISDLLREIGLQINDSKTDLLEDDEVEAAAEKLQKRGIEYALATYPEDSRPLEGVIEEEVLEDPSGADRTVLRYVTHRIRKHEFYRLIDKFDGLVEQMPQGADHFARLFRDSDRWTDLQGWFTGYCRSDWSCIDWAVGSMARMFPSSKKPRWVAAYFERYLDNASAPPLAVGAVFTQRLAAWDPVRARELLRTLARDAKSAQARRWIAFAGLQAGHDRGWATTVLKEFQENAITLAVLKAQAFRAPKVVADFSGD
jgi:hypothetical protein